MVKNTVYTEGVLWGSFTVFNKKTFCLDVSAVLQDGSSPTTTWYGYNPRSMLSARDRLFYHGQSGVIAKYNGYLDNAATYDMTYLTAWISFGAPFIEKILKKILLTVSGSNNTVFTVKWAFDYKGVYFTQQQTTSGFIISEYGIAQYGIAEYSSGVYISSVGTPGISKGKMLQIGFTCTVNGAQLALQKFDIFAKPGRMI